MRRLLLSLLLGLTTSVVLASPAWAVHNQDRHSENTQLLFNSQNPDNATNSDIAFWGNRAYQGDYGGFRIFDISNPALPRLIGGMRCFGPQNDPVVWQNLLFLAIDRTLTGPQCGSTATAHDNPQGWEGVRIFDVSNPAAPQQVGAVYADCGAHTITLNPIDADTIHLWVSSYPLRPGPTCGDTEGPRAGRDPLHGVIQVIEVPVNNPAGAREIAEPKIVYPGDPDNQHVWGHHGLPSPPFEPAARACHDITVFVELRLAAAACAEQGQLWRIRANGLPDTENPIWVFDDRRDANGATQNPGDQDVAVDFWHSATFSWDGKVVNFIDESFADASAQNCPPTTTITEPGAEGLSDTGRSYFVSTATGRKLSHFMIPRTETAATGCYNSAHLGNVATVIGRYLNVNAWYMGGMNVLDFTRPANPREVAFYDMAPFGMTGSDNWSAYHYEGPTGGDDNGLWIYATDGVHNPATGRGFEVFRTLIAGPDLTLQRLNPQTQERVFRCTVRAHGGALRANRAGMVHASVRVLGQVVPGLRVTLSGAGVRATKRTSATGAVSFRIRPTRGGALRVTVPSVPNMLGCATARRVRGVGPTLTGRPS